MTLVLRYVARSDRGLVRSNNEDSCYAGPRLLALADGMGGHAAGEVASQLVINSLRTLDDDEPSGDLLSQLARATRTGNDAIAAQVHESPELDGMGTTLTAILFAGSRIGLCHIGDSRGYMFRDGAITQITRDDTFVQTLVDEGRITAEQAHNHPQRSLIMRALTGTEVEPTLTMRDARAGDRYLLCSDGLSDVVTEDTLAETLGSIADPKECADRLIELALRGGGPDNVTVVLADVVDTEYGDSRPIVGGAAGGGEESYTPDPATAAGRAAALRPPPPEPQRPSVLADDHGTPHRSPLRRWITIGVALAVVAALIIGFFVFRSMVRSNYYVGTDDSGNVAIYQGSPEPLLFISMSTPVDSVCVTEFSNTSPEFEFAPYGDDACADPLKESWLDQTSRATLESAGISGIGLDEAKGRISSEFRLSCAPEPEPTSPSESYPPSAPELPPGAPQTLDPAPEPAPATTQAEEPSTEVPDPGLTPGPEATTEPDPDANAGCR